MAGRFEDRPHGRVVVDLAVVGDPDGVVLVGQRLMAAGEIDDAEAAVAERRVAVDVQAGAVGSAVRDDVAHPAHALGVTILQPIGRYDSRNAAHQAALTRTAYSSGRAAASPSTCSRNQNSSITRDHSRRAWSRRPIRYSSHNVRIAGRLKMPRVSNCS